MKFPPNSDVRKVFIEQLRAVRIDLGTTQAELAKVLGIQQSDVSKVERGVRRLDVVELRAWLAAMAVPFADFVSQLDAELSSRESLTKAWKRRSPTKSSKTTSLRK